MAIAKDTSAQMSSLSFSSGPTTVSGSYTVTGSNTLLVVWMAIWQDAAGTGTVSAMTYNGVAMTQGIASFRSTGMAGEMWYLVNPPTGAHTFSVTVTGATDAFRVGISSYTGVLQTSPLGVTNTATGASGNPAVSITTGTANSVSVAGLVRFGTVAITASTFTNLQRANTSNVVMTNDFNLNTTVTSYTDTQTGTDADDWAMGVAEFKPVVAGGTPTNLFFY